MDLHTAVHPFEPVWDERSRILILGSFPSVRSRQEGFYYAHPQNRFWPLLARLYQQPVPIGTEARRLFALHYGIALWDTIESCRISGSSDASIRDAVPNKLSWLIRQCGIEHIFCNGQQSFRLYERFCFRECGMAATALPSTSAANAAWSMDRLEEAWSVIKE